MTSQLEEAFISRSVPLRPRTRPRRRRTPRAAAKRRPAGIAALVGGPVGGHSATIIPATCPTSLGCCDNSPTRRGIAHWHAHEDHLIDSHEPGEDGWWCYADEPFFEILGALLAPSHP